MTVSNIITVSRIFLAPVFVALIVLCDGMGNLRTAALIGAWVVYLLIELSDLADGFFARLLKQESELGRVLDPFADSLSRLSCFLAFTFVKIMPLWLFIIVLYRDLWVALLRTLMAKKGRLQGARLSGKIKAWVYAITNIAALGAFTTARVLPRTLFHDIVSILCLICFGCVVIVALWSGLDYSIMLFSRKNAKNFTGGS